MHRPRPIVVIDTSVFISDALSTTQKGAASQVLAILPAVATIIMCEDIREELTEKLVERLGWTRRQVAETYGPIFDVALWLVPVEEQPFAGRVPERSGAPAAPVRQRPQLPTRDRQAATVLVP